MGLLEDDNTWMYVSASPSWNFCTTWGRLLLQCCTEGVWLSNTELFHMPIHLKITLPLRNISCDHGVYGFGSDSPWSWPFKFSLVFELWKKSGWSRSYHSTLKLSQLNIRKQLRHINFKYRNDSSKISWVCDYSTLWKFVTWYVNVSAKWFNNFKTNLVRVKHKRNQWHQMININVPGDLVIYYSDTLNHRYCIGKWFNAQQHASDTVYRLVFVKWCSVSHPDLIKRFADSTEIQIVMQPFFKWNDASENQGKMCPTCLLQYNWLLKLCIQANLLKLKWSE